MTIAILLVGLVLVFIVFALFISARPDDFRISCRVVISAPASVAFAQVNDLHKWQAWSPWEGIDPELKRTYEGPEAGEGASYAWEGKKTGTGKMTITQSRQSDLVRLNLDFLKPFKASNVVEFTFVPRGSDIVASWTMTGKDTFVTKIFCLVCNRDKMCGDMFDQGLAKLKQVCESA